MYYASAAPQKPYHIPSQVDDTIRVAFIGDSWAFYHKNHNNRMAKFIASDAKAPVTVVSRGFCGARSGRIYKAMFSEKGETFKDILTKAPHFCIVAAGVNDTYTKTGANAYAKNVIQIIQLLLSGDIIPIIIEIPSYNIKEAFERQTIQKKMLRRLSMLVTDSNIDCITAYRKELENKLQRNNLYDSIIYIRSRYWDDSPKLYNSDCLHLNDNGYRQLDSCIAQRIAAYVSVKSLCHQ